MAHVWRTFRGDPTEKLVLLSLADQANNDGWCWPSQAYTAERCMISDRQLRNWIVRLADAGLIEVHSRPGKSNMYRVLTPEADFHPPRKSTSGHPGSPLPTNHKEPSENHHNAALQPIPRCSYCRERTKADGSHYCSAMNMYLK